MHETNKLEKTVVNSEIIQRLGTYFPFAGGEVNDDGTPVLKDGKPVRDLQMTTIVFLRRDWTKTDITTHIPHFVLYYTNNKYNFLVNSRWIANCLQQRFAIAKGLKSLRLNT